MPVKKTTYEHQQREDVLVLDAQGYERLCKAMEKARKELQDIMNQKAMVREDDKIGNIDDPSTTWQLLLAQEAAKNEEIFGLAYDIKRAKVLEKPLTNDTVSVGDSVTLTFFWDDGSTESDQEFKLVALSPRVEEKEVSKNCPIGAGILGKKVGETTTVKLPNNHTVDILIISKSREEEKIEE